MQIRLSLKALSTLTVLMLFASVIFVSTEYAKGSTPKKSDFATFYFAACVMTDPEVPNSQIYDYPQPSLYSKYGITEKPMRYGYSIGAAYLLAPISLFSFKTAKIVCNVLNVITYVTAVAVVLWLRQVFGLRFIILLAVSLFWAPFLCNQMEVQTNTLILLFIALSVFLAEKKLPVFGGFFLGIASLFKLYPIIIAVVLGLKNWRITASCLLTFGASFLIPNSTAWFSSLDKSLYRYHSYPFHWLTHVDPLFFVIYVLIIASVTAFAAYTARHADYAALTSLALSGTLLIMPVINYHHFSVLIFCFICLFASVKTLPPWLTGAAILSFLLVYCDPLQWPFLHESLITRWPILSGGLFILWLSQVYLSLSRPLPHHKSHVAQVTVKF
ncbi:MAG: glycosyltransferase family 87 protein [Bacillota bacterium]